MVHRCPSCRAMIFRLPVILACLAIAVTLPRGVRPGRDVRQRGPDLADRLRRTYVLLRQRPRCPDPVRPVRQLGTALLRPRVQQRLLPQRQRRMLLRGRQPRGCRSARLRLDPRRPRSPGEVVRPGGRPHVRPTAHRRPKPVRRPEGLADVPLGQQRRVHDRRDRHVERGPGGHRG